MAEQSRRDGPDDWAPRGAMRGLLWWPPVAFLLAVAVPAAGLVWIVVSGVALAATGTAVSLVGRRSSPHPAGATGARAARTAPATTPAPAVELAPQPVTEAA